MSDDKDIDNFTRLVGAIVHDLRSALLHHDRPRTVGDVEEVVKLISQALTDIGKGRLMMSSEPTLNEAKAALDVARAEVDAAKAMYEATRVEVDASLATVRAEIEAARSALP